MEIADIDVEAMAHQALETWGLQSAKHELVSVTENIVFRVDVGVGKVLRLCLHRSWYHNLPELMSECQWTRALSAYGISTPVQVPAFDGNDYVLVRDNVSGEARYASMNQWIDGEIMGRIIARSEDFTVHFRRMGEMAARIHNQASNWKPSPGFTRHTRWTPKDSWGTSLSGAPSGRHQPSPRMNGKNSRSFVKRSISCWCGWIQIRTITA